jgi:regulatory protein
MKKRARSEEANEAESLQARDPEKTRVRTLQRAVKLLAAKPRSVGELRARLLEKSWATPEAVDAALGKLQEYGYLNDREFARGFAAARVRQKPMGQRRVARDLAHKKIAKETANEALEKVFNEMPEGELVEEAIARYTATRGRPATRQEAKRLFDFLLRRGFSIDLVIDKVRALSTKSIDEDTASSE